MVSVPAALSLWETVATIQILQASAEQVRIVEVNGDVGDLIRHTGLSVPSVVAASPLEYSEAYRRMEETDLPYIEHLAKASDLPYKAVPLSFPDIVPEKNGSIIVAPYGLKRELDLPFSVWQPIVQHLRSYGLPVHLMARRGQRMDSCTFTEGELLSNRSIGKKLRELAGAELIVGTPNEWMWLATAWEKKLIVLYPDHIPPRRWFWQTHDNYGRILYQVHLLQVPIVLAGLRRLISNL